MIRFRAGRPSVARHAARGLLLAAWLCWSPAHARTVEYLTDEAAIQAAAAEQSIDGPFAARLTPQEAGQIRLETPEAANHMVKTVSIYCQAYKIDNPVATLFDKLLNEGRGAGAGAGSASAFTVKLLRGSTFLRCLSDKDMASRCVNTVRLEAELSVATADGAIKRVPLSAVVERQGRFGGFCGNIARFTGIVTREAALSLLRKARETAAL